jgi:hypothetical protein
VRHHHRNPHLVGLENIFMKRPAWAKWAIVTTIAAAIAVFFALDLGRFLSLDYLRNSQAAFADLYAERPWAVRLGYFAVYVATTAFSLPGAVILTLAGGGIFGLGWGLLLVSFASSAGATLAFLAARFVLRDWVQARMGNRLDEINKGIAREGALYLFSLRLIPVVPFFVINLVMDFLLGQPGGHAGGYGRLRERRYAVGQHHFAARHCQPRFAGCLCAARPLSPPHQGRHELL